jgi:hypothetical protein
MVLPSLKEASDRIFCMLNGILMAMTETELLLLLAEEVKLTVK